MILEMPVDKGVCPGPGHPLPSLTPGGMLHRVAKRKAMKTWKFMNVHMMIVIMMHMIIIMMMIIICLTY